MKHFRKYDMLFIIISAVVLVIVNSIANPELIGKYSLIIAMAGYFIGKSVKKYEIKKKDEL